MAIKPKGKKVTGTKKKDKITWTSNKLWKKALTVKAGAGNDVINFKKSNYKNTLYGEAGNDKIYGGKKVDKIYGGKGNDKLYGYAGNDVIKGGAGNDYIDGGNGNDKIYGESGKNTIYGGAGNDVIYAGKGNDRIVYAKGSGNDVIYNSTNKDTLVLRNVDLNTDAVRHGNDLIIFQGKNDRNGSITLKNYYAQSASERLKKIYFEHLNYTAVLPDDMSYIPIYVSGKGEFYGTSGTDEFNITGGGSIVHSSGGNDIIRFNKTGNNTFVDDSTDSMNNTALYGLTGTDTIGVVTISGGGSGVFSAEDDSLNFNVFSGRSISIADFWDNPDCLDATILYRSGYNRTVKEFLEGYGSVYENGGNIVLDNTYTTEVYAMKAATITGGTSNSATSIIYTGNGNDVITVSSGNNYMFTHAGNDTININGGTHNEIHTGKGNDVVNITDGNYNSVSTEGSDRINITGGSDNRICAYNDAKVYLNGGTNDVDYSNKAYVEINSGNNTVSPLDYDNAISIVANGGNNTISGSNMNDSITALGGTLKAFGGLGNDTITGGTGDDSIYAGYSLNSYTESTFVGYGSSNDNILDGGSGVDYLYAYGENAIMRGGSGGGGDHFYALLSNNIKIYDNETDGYFNVLHIDKRPSMSGTENAYIAFDIKSDGNLVDAEDGILVLNSSSYNYWLNNGSFNNANNNYGGIHLISEDTDITDASNYAVSQILDSSTRHILGTDIATLASDVATWLTGTGYTSVSDALVNGTETDKSTLVSYFDNFNNSAWTTGMG